MPAVAANRRSFFSIYRIRSSIFQITIWKGERNSIDPGFDAESVYHCVHLQ